MKRYNRIKIVLAETNRTSKWLSEAIKKNKSTISRWCNNEMQPSIPTLFEIAEILEVDVRKLLVSNKALKNNDSLD